MSTRLFLGAVSLGFVLQAGFVLGADGLPAAELYVSPQGNDAWSGTLAAPNAAGTDGPLWTTSRHRIRNSDVADKLV